MVVAAGDGPALPEWLSRPAPVAVVAADGGLDRARSLGLRVDVAVGDFDSASPAAVAEAEAAGTRIVRHPTAKDATDLELALAAALELAPERLLVIASAGGRLDHLLAACLALASPSLEQVEVDALVGAALVHVVRAGRGRVLRGRPGELLTLLPVSGDAHGITTGGLVYPLRDETLPATSSRGVSNVVAAPEITVTLTDGVLLAVRPEPGQSVEAR
jgi:thiamine pyrophosphokinase